MENFIDDITTVNQFKLDNPELADQAQKAKNYLKDRYLNADEDDFIIIVVESCTCVAVILDDTVPYRVGEIIQPFDKDRIYPIQGLETKFVFKRYYRS